LSELGLDEIRFNLAATGYTHPEVLEHVKKAVRNLPVVTVEIPAIPEDAAALLAALPVWADLGVRYLNLHELMFEPGTPSALRAGPRQDLLTPDGHETQFHPASRELTLHVMQAVQAQGLTLAVNDCSMQNKLRQLRGRRRLVGKYLESSAAPETAVPRMGAPETAAPAALDADGFLQTVLVCPSATEGLLVHPDELAEARRRYPGALGYRLRCLPPLSLFEPAHWQVWQALEPEPISKD
jgi:hypothetical protein